MRRKTKCEYGAEPEQSIFYALLCTPAQTYSTHGSSLVLCSCHPLTDVTAHDGLRTLLYNSDEQEKGGGEAYPGTGQLHNQPQARTHLSRK